MAASGWYSQEALRITAELNGAYHTPEEIPGSLRQLTGKPVDRTFGLFPPFYTDCGKNITLGKTRIHQQRLPIPGSRGHHHRRWRSDRPQCGAGHAGLRNGSIGRHDLFPAPIHIGENVWLGANVTVLGGVTIGDNAVIAAGAVVTKNIPPNTVAAGVPARVVRTL